MIDRRAKIDWLVRITAVALLVTGRIAAADPSKTFERWSSGPISSVWKVVPPEALTIAFVSSLYSAQYPHPLKSGVFQKLSVFVSSDDAFREARGKGVLDFGYPWWKQLYDRYGSNPLPMAEVTGFGGSSVLRMRTAGGAITRVTLHGRDFFTIRGGKAPIDILEIYASKLPPLTSPKPHDWGFLHFYMTSQRIPSEPEAGELTRKLRLMSGETRITVEIRKDTFFADDGGFPVVYRFGPTTAPPPAKEFGLAKRVGCVSNASGIHCSSRR